MSFNFSISADKKFLESAFTKKFLSYNDCMDDAALHDLLKILASAGEKLAPEIKRDVEAIMAAFEGAKEVKPSGGLTRKAHQLVQKIRNPFFGAAHAKAAKQASNRLVKKTQSAFLHSLRQTVSAFGLHQQALLEKGIHQDAVCGPPSREGVPVKDWDDLQRLETAMKERNISMFLFGRMRAHEYDLLAKMAADGYRDRTYQEPDNIWNLFFHAGFLDAFQKNMSEDESILLAEAAARRDEPHTLVLRDEVETRHGRRLNVTPAFAAACESLLSKVDELTIGEAEALHEARGLQWSRQTEWLCKILAVPIEKKGQVEAFVGFLISSARENRERDRDWDYLRYNLEEVTKAFERRHIPPAGWLPGLAQVFGIGESFMARRFKDPAAFWALYEFVLKNSETHRRLTQEKQAAQDDEHRQFWQEECKYLDEMGVRYTLDEEGRPQVDPALDDDEDSEVDEPSVSHALEAEVAVAVREPPEPLVIDAKVSVPERGTRSVPRNLGTDLFGEQLTTPPPAKGKYGDLE